MDCFRKFTKFRGKKNNQNVIFVKSNTDYISFNKKKKYIMHSFGTCENKNTKTLKSIKCLFHFIAVISPTLNAVWLTDITHSMAAI